MCVHCIDTLGFIEMLIIPVFRIPLGPFSWFCSWTHKDACRWSNYLSNHTLCNMWCQCCAFVRLLNIPLRFGSIFVRHRMVFYLNQDDLPTDCRLFPWLMSMRVRFYMLPFLLFSQERSETWGIPPYPPSEDAHLVSCLTSFIQCHFTVLPHYVSSCCVHTEW